MGKVYKTSRKYACPYCNEKLDRNKLVDHIDKEHEELIPEGYTSSRLVYDIVNGRNHGTCMICKKEVYEWNDKLNRYNNLCGSKKCRDEVRRIALERHIRVYNKPTLLDDPEHQEKMLEHRKIANKYTFSDGGVVGYVGKYEKKTLEFLDKVCNIRSDEIQSPGPILEYEYNGKKHYWITDIYYIPANLIIEVKDGGDNPNRRSMPEYREKQIAKETMITELGKFHYIRLTNNDFAQLLDILADIKMGIMDNDFETKKIHINEEVNAIVGMKGGAYIVPYGLNNIFDRIDGIGIRSTESDKTFMVDKDNIKLVDNEEFKDLKKRVFKINAPREKVNELMSKLSSYKKEDGIDALMYSYRALSEMTNKNIENCIDLVTKTDCTIVPVDETFERIENGIYNLAMSRSDISLNETFNGLPVMKSVAIRKCNLGYYAQIVDERFPISSGYYDSPTDIEQTVIDNLQNEYEMFRRSRND